MTIEDILKYDDVKAINEKTRISASNIEKLIQKDFSGFKKVQALGLISILEREYGGVFEDLRDSSNEYFNSRIESQVAPLNILQENSSAPISSKVPMLIIGAILIGAILFLYSYLNNNQPQQEVAPLVEELNASIAPIGETNTTETNVTEGNLTDANATDSNRTLVDINTTVSSVAGATNAGAVTIVPVKRLWFATFDLVNKKTLDHTMTQPYDLSNSAGVLVATSVAPFSIKTSNEEKKYSDFKPHYFKISANNANEITKEEFISNGGPANMTR